MACVNCAKIRSAILHGKMAEAAGLSVAVFRERFGLFPAENSEPQGDGSDGSAEPAPGNRFTLEGAITPDQIKKMVAQPKRRKKPG